jgi:lambda repressor-like predicted transcriptional regulator
MKSARKDKRGHWPGGKRRSPADERERKRVVAALKMAQRQGESWRVLEKKTGVSTRTLRRLVAGEDWPMPKTITRIERSL